MVLRWQRVLVVENPAAGRRAGGRAGKAAAREFRRAGARVEHAATQGPGHARRLAAQAAAEGYDLVAAAGGDGTAHEVANGIAGSTTALGVIPAGTMNLLARVLGVPVDAERAAEWIVGSGRRMAVSPGEASGTLFLLMAGIGFDAWVLRELLRRPERKIGFVDYVRGGLLGLARYRFPRIRFEARGDPPIEGTLGILGRAPLYGGFLRPTPRVALHDEELELCALDVRSAGESLRLLPAVFSGGHLGHPRVTDRDVRAVRVSSDDPDVPVQLDGEVFGTLPMEFGVSPRKVWLAI